ncbi:hypothetical protein ACVIRO_002387 [Rhizobium ruizarguesonis]
MRDHDCIIKAFGGCACPHGECAEQPVTPAPVVIPTWRDHLAAIVFGLVIAGLAAGTMHALNEGERQYQMERRV